MLETQGINNKTKIYKMKKSTPFFTVLLFLIFHVSFSQTVMKELKIGHSFNISLPSYMTRTVGLNEAACVQYKSEVKDIYGFVIEDNKEELTLAELNYSSLNEFTDEFIKTFLKDEASKKLSSPIFSKRGEINFVEVDVTYYDDDAKIEIYYLVGIVESKTAFYKILSWSAASEKDTFKEDFRKILYSLKD